MELYEATIGDRRPGRHRGTVYTSREDNSDPVYVWHTATQITVHFGDNQEE